MEATAEYKVIFSEEAHEHLQEWEAALLVLEHQPDNRDLVHQMFRAIHTLKGSAGFIGFEKLQRVTHDLESALQAARDGAAAVEGAVLELLFRGLDLCRRMVDSFTSGAAFDEDIDGFLADVGRCGCAPAADHLASRPSEPPKLAAGHAGADGPAGSHRFELGLRVQASGREAYLRAHLIRNRLSRAATIINEDPTPEVLKDSTGQFAYRVTVATDQDEAALRAVLNIDQLEITSIREIAPEATKSAMTEKPAGGVESRAPESRASEVVRVSVERLDLLLNLVGELVIQNSGFVSIAEQLRGLHGRSGPIQALEEKTAGLATITRNLQDGIMKVRMLPVNNVFSRFHRVVRDLARDSGKDVTLEVFGEETEIDKKVMDRIGDPLVHLVRNAVDHGIEPCERRRASGKPTAGLIRLGAYQDGDHICIEVSDDGRGLDREAVLAKAVEKGLVRTEDAPHLSDERILNLIFLPGFSTAEKVTEVSGRGVGMDAVKRAVEALDGSVRVRSVRDRGTTVTISLPLTMAIIPALLVEVGDSILAIPLSSVKEVLKVDDADCLTVGGRGAIRLRERVLALISLGESLGLGASPFHDGARKPVTIVDYDGKRIGLRVDRILGNREVVIKSLSRHYQEIEGLIGASILGTGRIALIVDVEALVRNHYRQAEEHADALPTGLVELSVDTGSTANPSVAQSVATPPVDPAGAPSPVTPSTDTPPPVAPSPVVSSSAVPPVATPPADPRCVDAPPLAADMLALRSGAMEQIHNEGAIQASIALSQMSGHEIRVSFPESQLVPLESIAAQLGGEEAPTCGIYVGLLGDLCGCILMMLPEGNLTRFHELLYRLPPGSCASAAEVDRSCLAEMGNVLSACFFNALANGTHLRIRSEAPEISVDLCQAVIDSVLSRFNRPGDRLLLTKALLYLDDSQQVICHLLLFLEPESLRYLLEQLATAKG